MKTEVHIDYNAKYFRAKQAAKYLSISLPTFYRRVSDGLIPAGLRESRHCVIWKRETLDDYMRQFEIPVQS